VGAVRDVEALGGGIEDLLQAQQREIDAADAS
jgi:hypothetical protein